MTPTAHSPNGQAVSSDSYASARSKAVAVARMYHLGGVVVEPLGPGSKEKKSALIALGRFLGLDLSSVPTKSECGRRIAMQVGVRWSPECVSTGDTITLTGLNRLIDGAVARYVESGRKPQRSFLRELMTVNPAPKWSDMEEETMAEDVDELETGLLEQIMSLAEDGPVPTGVEVRPVVLSGANAPFVKGMWREPLVAVQGWLHLASEIDTSSIPAFDATLARLLGFDDLSAQSEESYLTALEARLELANEFRNEFIDELEDESEGSVTLATASARWEERWEDAEDEDSLDASGPITAEARTWEIKSFREYAIEGDLNLSPSYQRADVWPTADAQLLIESIIRGIPLPSVILLKTNNESGDHFEIVDGKQRLTSILRFTGAHPRALSLVRQKAAEWGENEGDLLTTFTDDYVEFKKKWRKHESSTLSAKLERDLYFPFPLRKQASSTLAGGLEGICGHYYSDIRRLIISFGGATKRVLDIFEKQSNYQIPVIIYSEATPRQIHEVFSLYNRQGKRLNAEEIRNAAFHELDLMRALLVLSGDADKPDEVAPFLMSDWGDLRSTGEALADRTGNYAMADAGYKRTKALSWVAAALVREDKALTTRSTANHINGLLKRVQEDRNDPLRDRDRIRDLMTVLDTAVDAHEGLPDEAWAPSFKNSQNRGRWQELQLVASLIALAAAAAVRGDEVEDIAYDAQARIRQASASWRRPKKTQSKEQWEFIGRVVGDFLPLLGVSVAEADSALRQRFGSSGVSALAGLVVQRADA